MPSGHASSTANDRYDRIGERTLPFYPIGNDIVYARLKDWFPRHIIQEVFIQLVNFVRNESEGYQNIR